MTTLSSFLIRNGPCILYCIIHYFLFGRVRDSRNFQLGHQFRNLGVKAFFRFFFQLFDFSFIVLFFPFNSRFCFQRRLELYKRSVKMSHKMCVRKRRRIHGDEPCKARQDVKPRSCSAATSQQHLLEMCVTTCSGLQALSISLLFFLTHTHT
jgi:hypothetical protein